MTRRLSRSVPDECRAVSVEERDPLPGPVALPGREAVEDFLYHEAELLDAWCLEEWLGLFEPGATYEIPSTDTPDGRHGETLYLVSDDWTRLQARVKRLSSRNAHVENPRSRTRRLITNVRVAPGDGPGLLAVSANFLIARSRYQITDFYPGTYHHVLVVGAEPLRFRRRKAVLDLEALRPVGKVSIII